MENETLVPFDVIPLPTKGIFYENGKDKIKVAYLTAADENILSSPNLLKNGNIIDELLKHKILDRDITVNQLHDEDKRAILLFLRNTAYGSNITLTVKDPDTGKDVEVEYDLENIEYKEFNLEKNKNGFFNYTMPKSGKKIEFKFMTVEEIKSVQRIEEEYENAVIKPYVTKQLEHMIVSIDGVDDRMTINREIQFLPIYDSQEFRRYVKENMPGIDTKIEVFLPSGKKINTTFEFNSEFFRPFYGV